MKPPQYTFTWFGSYEPLPHIYLDIIQPLPPEPLAPYVLLMVDGDMGADMGAGVKRRSGDGGSPEDDAETR